MLNEEKKSILMMLLLARTKDGKLAWKNALGQADTYEATLPGQPLVFTVRSSDTLGGGQVLLLSRNGRTLVTVHQLDDELLRNARWTALDGSARTDEAIKILQEMK